MRFQNLWRLMRAAAAGWSEDRAASMGAALAYYTLFSILPLLLLLITVAGLFFEAQMARGQIVAQLGTILGPESAAAVDSMLEGAGRSGKGLAATLVSFVTLLIGATSVLAELQSDLDRIFKAPPYRRPKGLWGLLRTRFLSLGLILGIAFLLVVSLTLSAALAALGKGWGEMFGDWTALLQGVNFVFDFLVITAVIAIIYKLMPSVRLRWHDVWRGAMVTALLLALGKLLIGLYIGKTAIASGFGAAGSLIVILVWVYYSTQIFLLGAEFTAEFARTWGSRAGAAAPAPNR